MPAASIHELAMLLPSPIQAYTGAGRASTPPPKRCAHGLQVGEHLARVQQIGEAVDHRHRRVARQLRDAVLAERAHHDAVAVARQHARGVARSARRARSGCPAAEVRRAWPPSSNMRDLEADARARRRLLEHHAQHAARAAWRAACAPRAARAAPGAHDAAPRCRRREGRQKLRKSRLRAPRVIALLAEHVVEDRDRLVDLRPLDDVAAARSARRCRRRPTAAGPCSRARDHDVGRLAVDDRAPQQAAAARPARPRARAARPAAAAPSRGSAPTSRQCSSSPSLVDRVCTYERRRAGERVAAERRRVRYRAGLEARARPPRWRSIAPIGTPPPRPLASVMTSGTTPSCS